MPRPGFAGDGHGVHGRRREPAQARQADLIRVERIGKRPFLCRVACADRGHEPGLRAFRHDVSGALQPQVPPGCSGLFGRSFWRSCRATDRHR